jgi:hypothetical protein
MRSPAVPALAALAAYACAPRPSVPTRAPAPSTATVRGCVEPSIAPPAAASAVVAKPPALPVGLTSFGAAWLDGRIHVLGGWRGEPHAYDREHQSDAFLVVDPMRDAEWRAAPGLGRVQSPALVTTDAGLVATGGLVAHNATGTPSELESLDRVARFDVASASWRPLPPLPEPRSSHDATLVDGDLWLVGGWRIDRSGASHWHDTAIHRPATDDTAPWRSVALPQRRRAHAVVGLPGRLVVIGGMTPTGPTSLVDVLDLAGGTWSKAPPLPGPGFGAAAVRHGDAVIANGADGVLWRWVPGASAWTSIGRLAFPRFFHRMVVDDAGALLVVGGVAGSGSGQKIRASERVVLGADDAHVVTVTLEAPGLAKNRQGLLLARDRLWVVGGNTSLEQHDFAPERFVDEVHALELGTLTWSAKAPLPARRQSLLTTTTSTGQTIVVGGFGHDGEVARTWSDGWTYDAERDRWSPLPSALPASRSQAGLVEHAGELWLLGGLDYDPTRSEKDRFRHPRRVLTSVLSPLRFRESSIELPRQRRAFGGALLGGDYVMVGGLADGFATVAECEALSLERGTIRRIACPESARLSPELVAIDGQLLLAGGMVDGQPETSMELYDPATDRWRTLDAAMPLPIPHLRLLPWGERVLAFSAHDPDREVHLAIVTLTPAITTPHLGDPR